MGIQINRETIKAFILNELSGEMLSIVSDAILTDERLARMFEEEKFKIDIKRYRDNEMTPTQRLEFEDWLMKEMAYSVEVNPHEEKNSSSEEFTLRGKLDEAHSTYKVSQKQHSTTSRTHSINRRFKYWLAAASIVMIFIVAGGISYNMQPSDSLENRLYTEYYCPLDYMNGYVPNNISFIIAKKYMQGDFANALQLLKDLPASATIAPEKNLFIGLSFMGIGRYKAAATYLEQAITSQDDFNYIPQARWYLGLCYLKTGDRGKAIDTFRAIVDSNDYNYKKAKQILVKLLGQ